MRASAGHQAALAGAVNVAAFFLTILHAQRSLPCQREHVVGYPIEAYRAMQIGHRREVVHEVNRQATLEQSVPLIEEAASYSPIARITTPRGDGLEFMLNRLHLKIR